MNRLYGNLLGAISGLLAGWLSVEIAKPEKPDRIAPEESEDTNRPLRPIRRTVALPRTVEECRAALAEAEQDPNPLVRNSKRDAALRRWLELDSDDAMREVLKDPGGKTSGDLLISWIQIDPARAMEVLRQAGPPAMRQVGREMFALLMARDPALAISELGKDHWNQGDAKMIDDNFKAGVYQQWMVADPQAAAGELRRMFQQGGWETNLDATRSLFVGWARTDFRVAWDFLTGQAATKDWMAESDARGEFGRDLRKRVLQQGVLEGSRVAETELLRFWDEMGAEAIRGEDSPSSILWGAVARDPYRILEFAEGIDSGHDSIRKELFLMVMGEISHSDPVRALELFKQAPPDQGDYRKNKLREVFASLAIQDPARAEAELLVLPAAFQVPAIGGWLTTEYANDPQSAIRRYRDWAADPAVTDALGKGWAMAFSWGHGSGIRDPKPFLDAVPALNDAVDCDVLSTWVKGNPREAATWISDRIADGHAVDFGREGILGDLSNAEPQWMSGWVSGIQDAEVRKKAVRTLAKNWMAFDPQGAGEWLDGLGPGEIKDWANGALAGFDD